ncbi:hypothetical protein [Allohahella marinimesophila]|uniref:Uncharacterized protein n=1 Tax=Allohahella marinimesophila TaxID=1054972 RepID=A0ABP7P9L1_9GAMM
MAHTGSFSLTTAKLFSSVIYSAAVPVVIVLVGAMVAGVESTTGLHIWFRRGDLDIGLSLLTGGTLVFFYTTGLVVRLEQLIRPGLIDHVRQTFILYMAGIVLGSWLVVWYRELGGGLQYGYGGVLFLTILQGIVVNALTLAHINRRAKGA